MVRPIARQLGWSIRTLAMRWLAAWPTLCSIEPNIVSFADLEAYAQACDGQAVPDQIMRRIDALYTTDFYLGPDAHPLRLEIERHPHGYAAQRLPPTRGGVISGLSPVSEYGFSLAGPRIGWNLTPRLSQSGLLCLGR